MVFEQTMRRAEDTLAQVDLTGDPSDALTWLIALSWERPWNASRTAGRVGGSRLRCG